MRVFLRNNTAETQHEFDAELSTARAAGSILFHKNKFYQFAYTVKGGGIVVFEEAELIEPSIFIDRRETQ